MYNKSSNKMVERSQFVSSQGCFGVRGILFI